MPGPGEYRPDRTEGVTRPEDLPEPIVRRLNLERPKRRCPKCGYRAFCNKRLRRRRHDLGDPGTGRPRGLGLVISQHHCTRGGAFFDADTSALAPKASHYTHRVIARAIGAVVEDGLPYRVAFWRLWRDFRVFVPFGAHRHGHVAGRARRRTPRGALCPARCPPSYHPAPQQTPGRLAHRPRRDTPHPQPQKGWLAMYARYSLI